MPGQSTALNIIIRHVWSDPRRVAEIEWMDLHPGPGFQIEEQVGREAMEQFAAGGGWPDPDARITIVMPPDPPDWDWWEPTTRWRREQARGRELDAKLAALDAQS